MCICCINSTYSNNKAICVTTPTTTSLSLKMVYVVEYLRVLNFEMCRLECFLSIHRFNVILTEEYLFYI